MNEMRRRFNSLEKRIDKSTECAPSQWKEDQLHGVDANFTIMFDRVLVERDRERERQKCHQKVQRQRQRERERKRDTE